MNLGVNRARAWLVGQAEFQTLEGTVLMGTTVSVGAAVARVPNQKETAEKEQDRARSESPVPSVDGPRRTSRARFRGEPMAGQDRRGSAGKVAQSGQAMGAGRHPYLLHRSIPVPCATSQLIFPSGLIWISGPFFARSYF